MKGKIIRVLGIVAAALLVGAVVLFVDNQIALVASAGAFIGVDIAAKIRVVRKGEKPDVVFKDGVGTYRYIVALCAFALLAALTFYLSMFQGREMNSL